MTHRIEPIEANLHHEVIRPRTRADACPTLVLLHGRGDSAAGILPLAYEFERDDLLVVSVQAPLELGGDGGRVRVVPVSPAEPERGDAAGQPGCAGRVPGHGQGELPGRSRAGGAAGLQPGGGDVAGGAALRPESLAGVIALSGYFPIEVESDAGTLVGRPAFVAHGVHDDIIPVEAGRRTRDLLERHGVNLTYREYPMAHQVSAEEMQDVREWLNRLLDSSPPPTTPLAANPSSSNCAASMGRGIGA